MLEGWRERSSDSGPATGQLPFAPAAFPRMAFDLETSSFLQLVLQAA